MGGGTGKEGGVINCDLWKTESDIRIPFFLLFFTKILVNLPRPSPPSQPPPFSWVLGTIQAQGRRHVWHLHIIIAYVTCKLYSD